MKKTIRRFMAQNALGAARYAALGVVILACLAGCPNSSGGGSSGGTQPIPGSPDTPVTGTAVRFENPGDFPVSVYSNPARGSSFLVAEIPGRGASSALPWAASPQGTAFYLSYVVTINDIQIPVTPSGTRGVITPRIDSDKTTAVSIPRIDNLYQNSEPLVPGAAFLSIQNKSASPFRLLRGSTSVFPMDYDESLGSTEETRLSLVNAGETRLYKITAGSASSYKINVSGTPYNLPFTEFQAGNLYLVVFTDGQAVLDDSAPVTVGNLSHGATPDFASPQGVTAQRDGGTALITWNAPEGNQAAWYRVYRSTSPHGVYSAVSDKTLTGTDFTDAAPFNEAMNYYKVRAYSADYGSTSDFSAICGPVLFDTPPILPAPAVTGENRRLMVSWQRHLLASAYEVFYSSTNDFASAARAGGDVNSASASIDGLSNGVVYYVWVRAKNQLGNGEPSAAAWGIPGTHTQVPAAPAAPVLTVGRGELFARWQAADRAQLYNVYVSTQNDPQTATEYAFGIAGTNRAITGLNIVNPRKKAYCQ